MRSTLRPLLAVAAALSLAACNRIKEPEGRHVTVLFTTDEHSNLFAVGPEVDDFDLGNHTISNAIGTGSLKGGVARRFAILQAERAAASARNSASITLSAGDFTEGSLVNAALLQTAPDLVLMKRMGYDAVALGNHEFDFGPSGLAGQIQIASTRGEMPPLVLTNVVPGSTDTTALAALYGPDKAIAPSRVITAGGIKIGIVSWIGVGAGTDAAAAAPVLFWSSTAATAGAKFADIAAAVQAAVNGLRASGVDTVIGLGHGGIGPLVTGPGDDEIIASLLSGVDLVVSGHSHKTPNQPYLVPGADGRLVPVVQPGPYGHQIGRVELIVPSGGRAVVNSSQTAFIPVDDRTAPTTDTQIVGELLNTIDTVESGFIPATLLATGICAPADTACYTAANLGDLYYKPLCHTTFYTRGLGAGESNVTNLDTDAMLAIANQIVGAGSTTLALQNYGSIRSDLFVGKTGDLSFADLYRAVPNGVDPPTGTPGFPLVRLGIANVELRIALEGALLQSLVDGDFFLSGSGIRVEYDRSRPMFDPDPAAVLANPFEPGWITRIEITSGTTPVTIYDVSQDGIFLNPPYGPGATHFLVTPTSVQQVVTTYFVASFASAFGVHLYNLSDGTLLNPPSPAPSKLYDAVLHWAPGTPGTSAPPTGLGDAVKDHQAFLEYVHAQCTLNAGELPARYDDADPAGHVPRRMVDCTDGVCL